MYSVLKCLYFLQSELSVFKGQFNHLTVNNPCNRISSGQSGPHKHRPIGWSRNTAFLSTVLKCKLYHGKWNCQASYLSSVEVGCRRLMSATLLTLLCFLVWDQHWYWASFIIPIIFFLVTFQSTQRCSMLCFILFYLFFKILERRCRIKRVLLVSSIHHSLVSVVKKFKSLRSPSSELH